jgi:hypothetical protein
MIFKQLMPAATVTVLSAWMVLGCAGQSAPPPQRIARPANRYIYVTAQNLPGECYTDLGSVKFTQSFGEATVDPDQTEAAKQLRATALKSYPQDVDAVIDVKSDQNDVGSEVTVSGEAVRLEDHPTVQCTLRGSKGVIDAAALIGAGGIGGAAAGGLMGGAGAAASVGVAGAAIMGAHEAAQHQAAEEQQQEAFRNTLGGQRREIARLLKERAQLRKCQEDEVPLKACLASPAQTVNASEQESATGTADQDIVNAGPFEIQKHLQEQQDYIKQLQDEIAQIKWQMGGR